MAIEKVFVYNNSSIVQDEVLAHRLGLVPIYADPRYFSYPPQLQGEEQPTEEELLNANPDYHIVFELKAKCKKNPQAPDDAVDPDILYLNNKVTTKHMKWIPIGDQTEKFGINGVRP